MRNGAKNTRQAKPHIGLSETQLYRIQNYDIDALAELFQRLVEMAPRSSQIICFIDRVPSSELEVTSEQRRLAINELHQRLVVKARNSDRKVKGLAKFKLFVTAPSMIGPDTNVWFSEENFLSMDDVRQAEQKYKANKAKDRRKILIMELRRAYGRQVYISFWGQAFSFQKKRRWRVTPLASHVRAASSKRMGWVWAK